MAITDIQITPGTLTVDPQSRSGQLAISISNLLGRDGVLSVSVLPDGAAKEEWFRLADENRAFALEKNGTTAFRIEVVIPADVAPGKYSYAIQVADDRDAQNLVTRSEKCQLVVGRIGGAAAPGDASKRWLIALGVATTVVLLGGGIAAALWIGRGSDEPKASCDPACGNSATCVGGQCTEPPPLGVGGAAPANCATTFKLPCGKCNGTIKCDGSCSLPTPPNHDQPCGACGRGKIDCSGTCAPPDPADLGQTCNTCGGKIDCGGACTPAAPSNLNQPCGKCGGLITCDGGCSVATPADLDKVVPFGSFSISIGFGVREELVGGRCSPGFVFQSANTIGSSCVIVGQGAGANCAVRVRSLIGGCRVEVAQRRACD